MENKTAELKDRLNEAITARGVRATDISAATGISKSALSQYRSGLLKGMHPTRLYSLCEYLDVSETWMLGYDVPMTRITEKRNELLSDVQVRMLNDKVFMETVQTIMTLPDDSIAALNSFLGQMKSNT